MSENMKKLAALVRDMRRRQVADGEHRQSGERLRLESIVDEAVDCIAINQRLPPTWNETIE